MLRGVEEREPAGKRWHSLSASAGSFFTSNFIRSKSLTYSMARGLVGSSAVMANSEAISVHGGEKVPRRLQRGWEQGTSAEAPQWDEVGLSEAEIFGFPPPPPLVLSGSDEGFTALLTGQCSGTRLRDAAKIQRTSNGVLPTATAPSPGNFRWGSASTQLRVPPAGLYHRLQSSSGDPLTEFCCSLQLNSGKPPAGFCFNPTPGKTSDGTVPGDSAPGFSPIPGKLRWSFVSVQLRLPLIGFCRRLQPNSSGAPTVFRFCSTPGNLRWGFVADLSPAPRNVQRDSAADFSPNSDETVLRGSVPRCSPTPKNLRRCLIADFSPTPPNLCWGPALRPPTPDGVFRLPTATHRSSTPASTRERSAPRVSQCGMPGALCGSSAASQWRATGQRPARPFLPSPWHLPQPHLPGAVSLPLPSSSSFLLPSPDKTGGRGTHCYPLPARTLRGTALNGALRLIYGESPFIPALKAGLRVRQPIIEATARGYLHIPMATSLGGCQSMKGGSSPLPAGAPQEPPGGWRRAFPYGTTPYRHPL